MQLDLSLSCIRRDAFDDFAVTSQFHMYNCTAEAIFLDSLQKTLDGADLPIGLFFWFPNGNLFKTAEWPVAGVISTT